MPRILIPLLAAVAAVALPATADAAVLPDITGDTLTVTGDGAADQITLRLAAPNTVEVAGFSFSRDAFDRISIRSGGGDDTVRIEGAITEPTTIETGAGADVVTGGPAAEIISTADGDDLVRTGGGDDLALLGAGADTAIQGPGDGFDSLEGQTGSDTVRVVGSGESEEFTLQAVGTRARITRDTDPVRAEVAGIEVAEVSAAGGADLIDLGDLGPTELQQVEADLGVADGAADAVAGQGRSAIDFIDASASGEAVSVTGLPGIQLRVENAQPDDRLTVFGLDGTDILSATGTVGERIGVTLDGGAGGDTLVGGDAAETLRGGPDLDVVDGGRGDDRVSLGDGNDVFTRSAQSGNDVVDGDGGADSLTMSTTDADDTVDVSAAGARTRVTATFTGSVDLSGMESIFVQPLKGTDNVVVRDLAGTGTQRVNVDFSTGDLRTDTMTVVGTPAADNLKAVSPSATEHVVTGLGAEVRLVNPEQGQKIVIDGRDGDDTIDATAVAKDKTQPFLEGGPGKDLLAGSPGQDVVSGGQGNDVALLRGGLDTFKWLPGEGNDIVEGGAGTDFLNMSGSGANEKFDVSPIGGRVLLTRDVSGVVLDLGDVERLDVMPAAGADTMHVADVSGTDLDVVTWELAPVRGTTASDGALDRVTIDGTNGNDAIDVSAAGQEVRVAGLPSTVAINRSDAFDTLTIDSKLGNDLFSILPRARELITLSTL